MAETQYSRRITIAVPTASVAAVNSAIQNALATTADNVSTTSGAMGRTPRSTPTHYACSLQVTAAQFDTLQDDLEALGLWSSVQADGPELDRTAWEERMKSARLVPYDPMTQ